MVLFSCKDENDSGWEKEMFNSEYNIMFPRSYTGGRDKSTDGETFTIRRDDLKVIIGGGFCDPAGYPCVASDYSGENYETIPDSITFLNSHAQIVYLNKRLIIYDNQDIIGCFCFTNSLDGTFRDSFGRIILRTCDNSCYRIAGSVDFASSEQDEVEEIINTLNPR